jgi:hypothetical protein
MNLDLWGIKIIPTRPKRDKTVTILLLKKSSLLHLQAKLVAAEQKN